MKKDEWEKKYHYGKRNCSQCLHYIEVQIDGCNTKHSCVKKREAGAGEAVKPSYDCDLWEHRG
ncbi:MAG: hypothetical protein LBO67_04705 [Spirochaetaceae bacterium]|jgi:hypothetical protein|nr:hypothetical protein [Spirochaetaceae bacterium]